MTQRPCLIISTADRLSARCLRLYSWCLPTQTGFFTRLVAFVMRPSAEQWSPGARVRLLNKLSLAMRRKGTGISAGAVHLTSQREHSLSEDLPNFVPESYPIASNNQLAARRAASRLSRSSTSKLHREKQTVIDLPRSGSFSTTEVGAN